MKTNFQDTFFVVRPFPIGEARFQLTEEIWGGGYGNVLKDTKERVLGSGKEVMKYLEDNRIEEVIAVGLAEGA